MEKAGMAVLNQAVLKPYGVMTSLKLDTTARTIEAKLELKGETERLRLHIQEYELRQEGNLARRRGIDERGLHRGRGTRAEG